MLGRFARFIQTYTAYCTAVIQGTFSMLVLFGVQPFAGLTTEELVTVEGFVILLAMGWITQSVTPNTRPALMQLRAKGIDVRSNGVELHAENES